MWKRRDQLLHKNDEGPSLSRDHDAMLDTGKARRRRCADNNGLAQHNIARKPVNQQRPARARSSSNIVPPAIASFLLLSGSLAILHWTASQKSILLNHDAHSSPLPLLEVAEEESESNAWSNFLFDTSSTNSHLSKDSKYYESNPEAVASAPDHGEEDGLLKSSITAAVEDDYLLQNIMDWIKESGGYINDKVELRRAVRDDPTSVRGIFANHDVAVGETLFTIPWDIIYHPPQIKDYDKQKPPKKISRSVYFDKDNCKMIERVYRDMKSDNPTPHGNYLKHQTRNYIPSMWTDVGKQLLADLIGNDLPPVWEAKTQLRYNFLDECQHLNVHTEADFDSDLYNHAWMMVTARADDEILVPFYDMINHANGKKYNTKHDVKYGISFSLVATQDVGANGQFYSSYNQCNNACSGWNDYFGTPDMFLWFGFVEDYPQRFVLCDDWYGRHHGHDKAKEKMDQHYRIKFDIERNEETGELQAIYFVPPSKSAIEFMTAQLQTLTATAEAMQKERKPASMPDWEWDGAWRLHKAFVDAFRVALKDSKGVVSEEVWEYGSHEWYKQQK